MTLPSLLEYQQAVNHPALAFPRDPALAGGVAEKTPLGIAAVASGGFAATFKVTGADGKRFAVRCFHKQGNDSTLAQRYEQIDRFVAAHPDLGFMVDVQYDPTGITVLGRQFPTVRMPWVDGDPLGDWVDDHYDEPDLIDAVRRGISSAVSTLGGIGVAHGDLQHGNIIVGPGESISLIDYDGMYLPELAPYGAAERGHPNYQHPTRNDATYDQHLDTFSAYLIDLSLEAIALDPDLWDTFGGGGQNLLFSATDFVDPDASDVFKALLNTPLAPRVQRLRGACLTDYESVARALRGEPTAPRTSLGAARTALDVITATEAVQLRSLEGDQRTVSGVVKVARTTYDNRKRPIVFLNFGDYRRGDFTIVAFGDVAKDLHRLYGGVKLPELAGKSVTITGLITLYQSKYSMNPTPQIQLNRAKQLQIQLAPGTRPTPSTSTVRPQTTSNSRPQAGRPAQSFRQPPASAASTTAASPRATVKSQLPTGATPAGDLLSAMAARFPTPAATTPLRPKTPAARKTTEPRRSPQPAGKPKPPSKPEYQTSQQVWTPATRPTMPYVHTAPPSFATSHVAGTVRRRRSFRSARRSRRSVPGWVYLVAVLMVAGLLALASPDRPSAEQEPPAPVQFRSLSGNLACMVTFGNPQVIRCDAKTIHYQPFPPAVECNQPSWGHTIVLTAGGAAEFVCAAESLIDESLPVIAYGTSRVEGPFACDSDKFLGITCRDWGTGRGFRIERDSFELF
jgi:hypothetical protein